MADDERQDEKSLELPSLRSAFRRRRPQPPAPAAPPDAVTDAVTEPEVPERPPAVATPESEPVARPDSSREPEPVAAAATSSTAPVRPTQASPDRREDRTGRAKAARPSRHRPRLPVSISLPSRVPRPRQVHVPGALAAAVTGAVVGLVVVGLTVASLHLCASMRGTSSCGKPGILLLLAITVVALLLGSLLLRLAGVDAHGSTSFLGVGLLVVLILLVLLPMLEEWWVVIVVPAVALLTYLGAWWVTSTYVEPGDRPR